MKHFFFILFGGLLAIFIGMGFAYGGGVAWSSLRPHVVASAAATQAAHIEQTAITGFKRIVRFSADEEEDLINAAALSLPMGADGRVTAPAYLVKNLTRGDAPIEQNADKLQPIASLTKLATAVVARRLIPADERVTITQGIINTYGNTAGFKVGETFRAGDLLYPLLMVSSNDAAEAFAQHYDRKKFIKAMNDFAQEIGAYRTYFADPSGLSAQNVSTANDLALMLDWIRKNDPKVIDITDEKTKTVRAHTWVNPTHFLSWSYYLGGKNGFTDEANRTTASLFELGRNKNVYAVILLGSESRDGDVVTLLGKVKE